MCIAVNDSFTEALAKRLAEAAEDGVVQACFFLGDSTDIMAHSAPDYAWAKAELEYLEGSTSPENAAEYTERLEDLLRRKIRAELVREVGDMVSRYYSIPAGVIESKVALAIRRATLSTANQGGE